MTVYLPRLDQTKTRTIEERVMKALKRNGREGLTAGQMSELFGITAATVIALCDKLTKKGLLDFRRDDRMHIYSIASA